MPASTQHTYSTYNFVGTTSTLTNTRMWCVAAIRPAAGPAFDATFARTRESLRSITAPQSDSLCASPPCSQTFELTGGPAPSPSATPAPIGVTPTPRPAICTGSSTGQAFALGDMAT